jgi:hypothetical protein
MMQGTSRSISHTGSGFSALLRLSRGHLSLTRCWLASPLAEIAYAASDAILRLVAVAADVGSWRAWRQDRAISCADTPPTLDSAFPEIVWHTQRSGSRSTIGVMVEADVTIDLKGLIEAVVKANIPTQLFGYLSKLAGPGATMVPSRQLIPELKALLDAEMQKHRAKLAGAKAVSAVAKGKLGAFSQEMNFLKAFAAAHDKPIENHDEESAREGRVAPPGRPRPPRKISPAC